MKKKKSVRWIYLVPILFFSFLWIFGKIGLYNDSRQYLAMHIHREPLYPLFLWLVGLPFGGFARETVYLETLSAGEMIALEAVRFLQNTFAAFSVLYLLRRLEKEFSLSRWPLLLVCLLQLSPHVITPLFSASRLVMTNSIMSEALGLPLFNLFVAECIPLLFGWKRKRAAGALALALLLSLTRGQLMIAILLWTVVATVALWQEKLIFHKKLWKRLGVVILCVVLTFGGRNFLVRCYNLAFNGAFIGNTFGGVGLLANILYATDREAGQRIGDEEARGFFEMSYGLMEERQANYRQAPKGLFGRATHLESLHDEIKFGMIEEPWRAYHDIHGPYEYIPENQEADRLASLLTKDLLPACFGVWLYDYLALSTYGLIRSVAVVHPLLNWYALFVYLLAAVLLFFTFRKDPGTKVGRLLAFSLLCIAANVYATSLLIMCLSRYMIYCLPLFYTGLLLCVREMGVKKLGVKKRRYGSPENIEGK